MKLCVIDASVVAAALFEEEHCSSAEAILASGSPLLAPDLIFPEVANVIWKRHYRKEIDVAEAHELSAELMVLPLDITPSQNLTEAALKLALETGRTVYDSLYLALAIQANGVLLTVDKRLFQALSSTSLRPFVTLIGG